MSNQIIAEASIDVNEAPRQAENAQQTADNAKNLAEAANNNIKNINDPNYLSPFEKPQLQVQMDNFATIYAADKDIATSEGIDFTAYDAAYQAYLAYMTPLIADMTTYSPIVRTTFNSLVVAVQNAQKAFNAATQAKYDQDMDKAKDDIAKGQSSYAAMQQAVAGMKSNANSVATIASAAISSAGFANDTASTASQAANDAKTIASQAANNVAIAKNDAANALTNAMSAQNVASSAVATANSTASDFGKVSQKTDSALTSAVNAQSAASDAVKQASSAAADSKDAKQIAGAVSQSYKTLTDGSTMTIAELQNGLAAKLTKTDLDGYATQTWAQNKIKVTADDISGNLSSVKKTVDGQTTSINDLKADSSGFKSQFTTVNNTLGKQNTDIGTLQATSKSLSANFDSLSSDNKTNQHNIGQLQASATKFNSTLMTVQQQVTDSAVGTNLLANTADNGVGLVSVQGDTSGSYYSASMTRNDSYIEMTKPTGTEMYYRFCNTDSSMHNLKPGQTYTIQGEVYVSKGSVHFRSQYQSNSGWWDYSGCQSGDLATNTSGFVKVKYTFTIPENATAFYLSWQVYDFDSTTVFRFRRMKLEVGVNATDWCPNPADNATVTAVSKISQTVDGMQTDISKKIEQKDLNGYATQDWSNNQIKITADGISGALSSVKNTVDSHTTSINTLQADSNGFKDQFTKVNDTIGKQTTDIGTLQSDAKSLSSNFDSLNTDNGTNQHNISDLQQSARGFSSTLLTVQTQVQNSAVGTNLLTGTSRDLQTAPDSANSTSAGGRIHSFSSDELNILANNKVTARAFIHNTTTHTVNLVIWTDGGAFGVGTGVPAGADGYSTVTAYNATSSSTFGDINIRAFTENAAISGVQYKELKLEKGSLATDWCPNPADNATVTALMQVKRTADGAQALASNNKGDITNLQATAKGIQTTVSNNYSDLKSQNTQTAGLVQTLVGKSPSNIIKDGGFNNATIGKVPSGWDLPYGQIVANPDTVSNLVATGHPVLQINGRSTYNSDNYYGDWFDVQPGDQFYAEFKTRWSSMSQKGTIVLGVVTKDVTGNLIWTTGASTSSPGTWAKYTGVLTIPDGAVQARVWLSLQAAASTGAVQVTDLVVRPAYATQSDMTVLLNDINLRVKKGDVVNQFNIDAGGALLSTSGDSTKIVFSSPNIIFDSKNPVQIPNANIPGTLTGKTFKAGKITATTKINGADIEAPIIHSPSGSFKLDGNTGDIIGASIHSADNSWGISKDGNIHGATINAPVLNLGDNGQLTASYSVNDPTGYFQPINGTGSLNIDHGYIQSTANISYYNKILNGIGGNKWGHWESSTQFIPAPDQAHPDTSNVAESTLTPAFLKLDIFNADKSSVNSRAYIDGTGLYINDGQSQSVVSMLSDYELLSSGMAYLDSGIQMKKSASFTFGNLAMNGYHTIAMLDGHALYFTNKASGAGSPIEVVAKTFTKSSRLSLKHDITPLSTAESSRLLNAIDVEKFRYTHDGATYKYQYGAVIDDINELGNKQYSLPAELLSEDGTGINMDSLTGILIKRVQDQDKMIGELSMRLTRLEMEK
ncbi:hypothetical protein NR224_01110 [Pediococcus ethanolidurans]|uniref:hypothetical protein n=1 Tax=Pediococcus ethanolidurans TaxID=319653 RepID=UPI0021E9171D|nr:hypothetical protein [Pediococcus ethanolidurans]MCV3320819.1 hypothetical protein [Pediococcus ethanolidurans]